MSIHARVEELRIKDEEIKELKEKFEKGVEEAIALRPDLTNMRMDIEMKSGELQRELNAVLTTLGLKGNISVSQILDKALNYKSGIIT